MERKKRTVQSRKLREVVFRQLRQMRSKMKEEHPEVLETLQKKLVQKEGMPPEKKPVMKRSAEVETETVTIDRHKNLEMILKYAAAKPGSAKLKAQLKKLLN